jgi:hypothetical protein
MIGWRRFLAVASIVLAAATMPPLAVAEEAPGSPSPTETAAPTNVAETPSPTETPPAPSESPTPAPTEAPTAEPTQAPPAPTDAPTPAPTEAPTPAPGDLPSAPGEPPPAEPAPAPPVTPVTAPEAAPAAVEATPTQPVAPTYRIFATREGLVGHRTANGHRIRPRDRFVALPSWSVLSSRGGHEFQVRVTYRGRSVVLPVWDVGPWNTRDDYWNPNRRYGDLPVGLPMAQAARQQGYNGGRDEFGRRIRHANGIDIADGAFWDDLGMIDSDWVEVTFLWLGADPGATTEVQSAPTPLPEDSGPPEARVTEAAAHEQGLMVRWSGTDDGVGIASYDVQVRLLPDGGWTDWQQATTSAEALFVPPGPGEFAFRARARDWYGHEQAWRDGDDISVRVP